MNLRCGQLVYYKRSDSIVEVIGQTHINRLVSIRMASKDTFEDMQKYGGHKARGNSKLEGYIEVTVSPDQIEPLPDEELAQLLYGK